MQLPRAARISPYSCMRRAAFYLFVASASAFVPGLQAAHLLSVAGVFAPFFLRGAWVLEVGLAVG